MTLRAPPPLKLKSPPPRVKTGDNCEVTPPHECVMVSLGIQPRVRSLRSSYTLGIQPRVKSLRS